MARRKPKQAPLTPDREYALSLMGMVEELRELGGPYPPGVMFEAEADRLADSLRCVECGERPVSAQRPLFCSDLCQQNASVVRYVRKAMTDGRAAFSDQQEGIGQKLMQIVKGGYPAAERKIPAKLRAQILERDQRTCQICGKPGDEIDHIAGSANDPSNLRVTCGACNRSRVFDAMRPATDDEKKMLAQVLGALALRIAAPEATKLCDHEAWESWWRGISGTRREVMREIEEAEESDFEDVDGYLAHTMSKDD